MNETIGNILERRSVRKYQDRQLDERALSAILEAGRHAPSGGNNQSTRFLVIQSAGVIRELEELGTKLFAQMQVMPDTYKSLAAAIRASKKGHNPFTYGAPTLILVSNKRGYGNAMADCACALQNMMIAAQSLDVGTVWINQIRWLRDDPAMTDYLEKLGVPKDELVCGGLSAGYGAEGKRRPLKRDGNPVVYVR
ncbi:MAG: nitroreductase family protein [Christensenellales bacterium]|jgi:nitroreductase